MEKYNLIRLFAAIFIWGAAASAASADQTPLAVIQESNQKILDIYAAEKEINKEKEEEIIGIMNGVTDFEKISTDTISSFCTKLTPGECGEFNDVFKRLLRISSIKKLGRYRADRFDYLNEEIKGDQAVVRTLAFYKEDQVELDYHLELIDGSWKIVNYVADGVDTIRNYRKQFTRILKKESFRQLIERLEKKIDEYENENAESK
jgi:phospholipid transport system substrate-binding protein